MTIGIWTLTTEGSLKKIELADKKITSLDQSSLILPKGAYTTFRTYKGKYALRLEEHHKRLVDSARLADVSVNIDWDKVCQAIRNVLQETGYPETRIRLTLDLQEKIGTFFISVEELKLPSKDAYTNGVNAISQSIERKNPKAKLSNFISATQKIREQIPVGVNEVLMINDQGQIVEGLSSNFFAVMDGEIWTADEGVLSGITRMITLEAAKSLGYPVVYEGVKISKLEKFEEAFITSTTRSIMPVVRIDGVAIGKGTVGEKTRALIRAFDQRIASDLKEI